MRTVVGSVLFVFPSVKLFWEALCNFSHGAWERRMRILGPLRAHCKVLSTYYVPGVTIHLTICAW